MESLLNGQDLLKTVGAILTTATALLGLITGVAQLTGKSRARRNLEWAATALTAEQDEHRRVALEQIRCESLSYLASAYYVPLWRFTEHLFWLVAGPIVLFGIGAADDGPLAFAVGTLACLSTMMLLARRALRLYAERVKVAHQFNAGLEFAAPDLGIMKQMEGGTKKEFGIATLASISLVSASLTIAWMIATDMESSNLQLAALFLSVTVGWLSIQWARSHASNWAER